MKKKVAKLVIIIIIIIIIQSIILIFAHIDDSNSKVPDITVSSSEIYAEFGISTIKGKCIKFNGADTTNNEIKSCHWDFGDLGKSNEFQPIHTYSRVGEYTLKLTVKDKSNTTSSYKVKVSVYDKSYSIVKIKVVDKDNYPISDAIVFYRMQDGHEKIVNTDYIGIADTVCQEEVYDFYVYKEGYLPIGKKVGIYNNTGIITINIQKSELINGKIEAERLNSEQIDTMNININKPENQFIYEYKLNFDYNENDKPKVTSLFINSNGEFINSKPSWSENFNEIKHTYFAKVIVDRAKPSIPPILVILEITTNISWNKEFYLVNLIMSSNTVDGFSIQNAFATLNLPDGLSLADTIKKQNTVNDMSDINSLKTESTSWVVKADKVAKQNMEVTLGGTLTPSGTTISEKIVVDKPIGIDITNAFKLEINDDSWNVKSDAVHSYFKLTNISDSIVYDENVRSYLYDIKKFTKAKEMTLHYPNGTTEIINFKNGKPTNKYGTTLKYLPVFGADINDIKIKLKQGEYIFGELVYG